MQQTKLEKFKTRNQPQHLGLRILYQCYFFGLGLTILILTYISYDSFQSELQHYDYIIRNWQQPIILDIQVTNDQCAKLGDDFETLSLYEWPGVSEGCDCRSETREKNNRRILATRTRTWIPKDQIYKNSACNYTQIEHDCETIQSVPPLNLTQWSNGKDLNTFQICGKRAKNEMNLLNNIPQSERCEQKKCGSDTDTFYCVDDDQPCPITNIGLHGPEQNSLLWESEPIPEGAEKIIITSNFTLWYQRESNTNFPLSEFRVTEFGVCMQNLRTNISPGRIDFELHHEVRTQCEIDDRFAPLHRIDELNYFTINKLVGMVSGLEEYEIDATYDWGIYSRPYIQWKMSCRETYFNDFISSRDHLNDIEDKQYLLFIVSIVFFVVISVLLSLISCLNICGYDWPCIKGFGSEESNFIFKFEIIMKTIAQGLYTAVVIIAFGIIQSQISLFSNIIDEECTDQNAINSIGSLNDTIKTKVYEYNLTQIILLGVTSIMDIIALCLLIRSIKKRNMQKSQVCITTKADDEMMNKKDQLTDNGNPIISQRVEPITSNNNRRGAKLKSYMNPSPQPESPSPQGKSGSRQRMKKATLLSEGGVANTQLQVLKPHTNAQTNLQSSLNEQFSPSIQGKVQFEEEFNETNNERTNQKRNTRKRRSRKQSNKYEGPGGNIEEDENNQ